VGRGTTFILRLPFDRQPFQEALGGENPVA